MAIFSGKVVSAKFIDFPNNMLIEVLYQNNDEVHPYVLGVDFTQQDFLDLLDEVTLEKIQEDTESVVKAEQQIINKFIQDEIDERWANEQHKVKEAYDRAEKYAQEVIERELNRVAEEWKNIEATWKKIDEEYEKISKASEEINQGYANLEKASKEINEEYNRLEKASKEINEGYNNLEKASKEINEGYNNLEKASKEINEEYARLEKAGLEIEKGSQLLQSEYEKLGQEWQKIDTEYQKITSESSKLEQDFSKLSEEWKNIGKEYERIDVYVEQEKGKKLQEVQEEFQRIRSDLQSKFNLSPGSSTLSGKEVFALIDKNNDDNDFVFNLKVSILEDPAIAKSKDKQKKLAIRKSKSVLELLKIYAEMKEAA